MGDRPTLHPLRGASSNPWYALATCHGEPELGDAALQAKNRAAWNRYMASMLTEQKRVELVECGRMSADESKPLGRAEMDEIEEMIARHGCSQMPSIPVGDEYTTMDLTSIEFTKDVIFEGFVFPKSVDFSHSNFRELVSFENATFVDSADFVGTKFESLVIFNNVSLESFANFDGSVFDGPHVDFNNATFSLSTSFDNANLPTANFQSAKFLYRVSFENSRFVQARFQNSRFSDWAVFRAANIPWANFYEAVFSRFADFSEVHFSAETIFDKAEFCSEAFFHRSVFAERVSFHAATFYSLADFREATFCVEASFVNAQMQAETWFTAAKFQSEPPRLFGAALHQGTAWRDIRWPGTPSHDKSGDFIAAYECLKLEMDRLKKHEDELDFFAFELQARRVLSGPIRGVPIAVYGALCDYGRSYLRPLGWLAVTILIGALPFGPHFGWDKLGSAMRLSVANTLGVFGLRKDFIPIPVVERLPDLLKAVSAAQTIFGAALLFLFGLALRNRFRMR